ncbi:trypsin-like serine peptidase [Bacillus aerolatus]|uniref:trypsin-like serine peptidase n=1 Tax=Bacillus aerolatus TaxID=2653354 RepID=UPI001CDBE120|nr:serine protease [Bacillus aerolatus]
MDIFQVTDLEVVSNANSVVALFKAGNIINNGNGTSTLKTRNFGESNVLCSTEPFRNQPAGAFCSGFLVAPNIIATAGHCVNQNNAKNIRFVFGFQMLDDSTARTVINNTEIYRGVRVIARQQNNIEADWSLVEIDRPVTNHPVLRIRRTGRIPDGQGVYVIGHPKGIPAKFASGANVRYNQPAAFFMANLDTFQEILGHLFSTVTPMKLKVY